MSSNERVKVYFNKAQQKVMDVGAKNTYIVASRGSGKSEGIDAPWLLKNVFAMPRSAGALLSPTYGKLLRNTLPAIFHAFSRLGYHRNIHYFVGRHPAKELNFKKPYIDPVDYDYVICWFNGSIQHLISFDRAMSANSMSLDYIAGFEAKFLDFDKIKNEVLPANRGNTNYFAGCPTHHGQLYSTDMPTSSQGTWILDKEKEMDPELIEVIFQLKKEITYLRATKKYPAKLKKLEKELNQFRRHATYYAEFNVFDNIDVLGLDFVNDMARDLPPLIFQTAILNKKIKKIPNGFYASLAETLHYYIAYDNHYLESLGYNLSTAAKETYLKDSDVDPDLPLELANDYNAAINSLVCGQLVNDKECRTLKSLFVKTPDKLPEVINRFCDYYALRANRDLIYYYDSTAIADTPTDSESFADIVLNILSKRGWNVTPVYIGKPVRHTIKHQWFDRAFKGDPEFIYPMFNQDNNEYLLLAMDQTGIKQGRNGFEKDKDPEKKEDSVEKPDEYKTHITDAWDTLFIGMQFHHPNSANTAGATYYPNNN
jgi:hypothetical protein